MGTSVDWPDYRHTGLFVATQDSRPLAKKGDQGLIHLPGFISYLQF